MQAHFEGNYFDILEIHSIVKSLDGLGMLASEDSVNLIVDYIVNKGYDSEDYAAVLGLARATSLLHRLTASSTEVDANKIKSMHFVVHFEDFVRDNLKRFSPMQLQRLLEVAKRFERFSNPTFENDLAVKIEEQLLAGTKGKRVHTLAGTYDSDEDEMQGEDAEFLIKDEKEYEETENIWKK